MKEFSILIIDDEQAQAQSLKSFLARRNYKTFTANDGETALKIAQDNIIDIVLTDFQMPGWDGLTVLREMKNLNPEIEVIVMTAYGTIENAVNIMKTGAYDYLIKPIDLDELETIIKRIVEKKYLQDENRQLREQLHDRFRFENLLTQSSIMENVLSTAGRVASSKATILIRGESGTGKELIAKAIHFASPRKDSPFVTVNVASLSENILESELFGHEKGAFTGAVATRIGRFEEADGGTIFIDEVGDIPLSVQVKLLRTIQFGEYQKIGSNQTEKTDVRIIAATHRNLEEMIKNGLYREDLFYRLNVIAIQLPALRQRKEDIPMLADHFIQKYSKELQKEVKGLSRESLDQLMKYNYPGNVRELENIIQRAVVLARTGLISTTDLPQIYETNESDKILNPYNLDDNYESKMKYFERELVDEALRRTNGNKSAAARILGISERHLRSRLERL